MRTGSRAADVQTGYRQRREGRRRRAERCLSLIHILSKDTVLDWIKSGRLRASKLSGTKTIRISTDDIMAFYDANATKEKEVT